MLRIRPNLGTADRVVRFIMGLALIVLAVADSALVQNTLVRILLLAFGLLNVISALSSNCILYTMAGISTNKKTTPGH